MQMDPGIIKFTNQHSGVIDIKLETERLLRFFSCVLPIKSNRSFKVSPMFAINE